MSIEGSTPESVRWAVRLLCLWIAVELAASIVEIIRIDPAATNALRTLLIYSFGGIASLAVNGSLVYGINLRMNWARIAFLILRIVGWVPQFLLFSSRWRVKFGALNLLFACVAFPAGLIGLCLLFTPRANSWFRRPHPWLNSFSLDLIPRTRQSGWFVVPKFRDAILCGALLGFVFPLLTMALSLVGITLPDTTLFLLWPGWIMLRGMETVEAIPLKSAILLSSFVWNVPLYVIAFALLWLFVLVWRVLSDELTKR